MRFFDTAGSHRARCCLSLFAWFALAGALWADDAPPPQFARDIRPLLSDACFQCHGPDANQRQADLRLDLENGGAFDERDGKRTITPGDPNHSELISRINSTDPDVQMPPPKSGKKLSASQREAITRWIAAGAKWQQHWSFVPPERPPVPTSTTDAARHSPIDNYIQQRLQRDGLTASPEADHTTLLRRVTLDLTGLPPSPDDVAEFLADEQPDAYERLIDRLLSSPRYGERMAADWLDAARYADTSGYQTDGPRVMWRWRDWVIDAYNANQPFDQFTLDQLAGDMRPGATRDQQIATGFNRNHRGNSEGGIIPEEYAVEYVVDRVETTFTVWQGLTMGCARCHDHKFDALSQREFYGIFAYFNNIPERGKARKFGNSAPFIPAPTRDQQLALDAVDGRLAIAQNAIATIEPQISQAQAAWEQSFVAASPTYWTDPDRRILQFPLDGNATPITPPVDATLAAAEKAKPKTGAVTGANVGPVIEEVIPDPPAPPPFAEGRIGQCAQFDGSTYLETRGVGEFTWLDKFSIAAWIRADGPQGGSIASRMRDADESDGYDFHLKDGHLQANFAKRWLDDSVRVETTTTIPAGEWHHVLMTYDGTRAAKGVAIYIDGVAQPLKTYVDDLNQDFKTAAPFRIGSRGTRERFHGAIDDVVVYQRCLTPEDAAIAAVGSSLNELAARPISERTSNEQAKLRSAFLDLAPPESVKPLITELAALENSRETMVESFPNTMVMEELPEARPTYLLERGAYDRPKDRVEPRVPSSLPPLGNHANNRFGFAEWLIDTNNPLTARVTVNRFWQAYFGTGLVKTTEDFGSQGELPSHPELLDWLATEFVRTGWDVKGFQRLIVTSATYRQSSKVTPDLVARDPDNRLLARGPRFRLSAEMIRDQALAMSGLLAERVGGPSVKPYQPAGLWEELSGIEYKPDTGESLYRRTLYTFWKRTIAPPSMLTFDSSAREACTVRESRTNTPLQALTLMNDVTFVEAARVLAERLLSRPDRTPSDRLQEAFVLATSRQPRETELAILLESLNAQRARFETDAAAAEQLIASGEFPRNKDLDPRDVAAYMLVTNLILNMDEVVTKE